jgi:hypothetical protein
MAAKNLNKEIGSGHGDRIYGPWPGKLLLYYTLGDVTQARPGAQATAIRHLGIHGFETTTPAHIADAPMQL